MRLACVWELPICSTLVSPLYLNGGNRFTLLYSALTGSRVPAGLTRRHVTSRETFPQAEWLPQRFLPTRSIYLWIWSAIHRILPNKEGDIGPRCTVGSRHDMLQIQALAFSLIFTIDMPTRDLAPDLTIEIYGKISPHPAPNMHIRQQSPGA